MRNEYKIGIYPNSNRTYIIIVYQLKIVGRDDETQLEVGKKD